VVTSFKGRAEALMVDRFGHSFPQPFPNSVREVFAVEGAAFLIKRDIWEKLGGFDPRYFALCEDIDLCWRTQLLGYGVVVAPNSIVFHVGSATVSKTGLLVRRYLDFRNSLRTLLKNYSLKSLLKLLPAFLALELAESIFILFKTRDAHFIIAYIKAALWNIMNLKDTIIARSRIQSSRVIDDDEVMRRMMKTSAKLLFLFKYHTKLMCE
jgi:GT2 family glycosyltransferase